MIFCICFAKNTHRLPVVPILTIFSFVVYLFLKIERGLLNCVYFVSYFSYLQSRTIVYRKRVASRLRETTRSWLTYTVNSDAAAEDVAVFLAVFYPLSFFSPPFCAKV